MKKKSSETEFSICSILGIEKYKTDFKELATKANASERHSCFQTKDKGQAPNRANQS